MGKLGKNTPLRTKRDDTKDEDSQRTVAESSISSARTVTESSLSHESIDTDDVQ